MGTAVKRSGYGEVQFVSPFDIQTLHELTIERRVNEHAALKLTGTIPEEQREACIEVLDSDNNVKVNLIQEDGGVLPLFCGIVTDITIRHVRGIYYVELEALSLSCLLDVRLKNRSFQNTSMTYDQLLDQVLGDYPGSDVINMAEDAGTLEQFTLQYRETDWQFLKRLASRFAAVLVPDAAADTGPKLWFGLPEGRGGKVLDDGMYGASRQWERRGPDGGVLGDLDDAPETRYTVQGEAYLNLGDRVQFQGQELTVAGSTAIMDGGQFRFEYILMPEEGIRQKPLFNTTLVGASLEGRILEVKQDTVRLHLDIDAEQNQEEASWFPYTSVYTAEGNSGFYCMPQAGDAVQLYIPDFKEEKAMAQGSVRKGGATSPKTQDPSMKTWGTNHGKEMQMGQNHMSLIAKEGSLFINLDGSEGIQIVSDSTLIIAAEQDIELSAEKKMEIVAEEAIYLLCKESSVILDGNADIQGTEVTLEGLIKGPVFVADLPPIPEPEDPPPPQAPPKEEKGGFWGKMLDGLQIVLDVAGMVPGIGEIADLTNAAIYTARGDYTNATLSAAAMIPFAGWAATGGKFLNKGGKALDAMSTTAKYADNAADAIKAVDKATDAATTMTKLGSTTGKVTTSARKLEDVQKQVDAVQKMKEAMKSIAVGVTQDKAMEEGIGVLGEFIGEDKAMALGIVLGFAGGSRPGKGGGTGGGKGGNNDGGTGGGKGGNNDGGTGGGKGGNNDGGTGGGKGGNNDGGTGGGKGGNNDGGTGGGKGGNNDGGTGGGKGGNNDGGTGGGKGGNNDGGTGGGKGGGNDGGTGGGKGGGNDGGTGGGKGGGNDGGTGGGKGGGNDGGTGGGKGGNNDGGTGGGKGGGNDGGNPKPDSKPDGKSKDDTGNDGSVEIIKPSRKPDPEAVPSGTRTKIPKNADKETKQSLELENDAADQLAKKGYDTEQNPKVRESDGIDLNRDPDFRVEGKIFDCYSPSTNKGVRGIWSEVEEKVVKKQQTKNVVINLKVWSGDVSALVKQFKEWGIPGLEQVLAVTKDGNIIPIFP